MPKPLAPPNTKLPLYPERENLTVYEPHEMRGARERIREQVRNPKPKPPEEPDADDRPQDEEPAAYDGQQAPDR